MSEDTLASWTQDDLNDFGALRLLMAACDKEFMEMRLSAFEDLEKMATEELGRTFPLVHVTPARLAAKLAEAQAAMQCGIGLIVERNPKVAEHFHKYQALAIQMKERDFGLVDPEKEDKKNLLIDLMVVNKVCKSKSEARRLISQGVVKVQGVVIKDIGHYMRDSVIKYSSTSGGICVKVGKNRVFFLGRAE